jgi:hypothetical protein
MEKLKRPQLVKKFLALYGTRRLIYKTPSPVPLLSQIYPVHSPISLIEYPV